MINCVVDAKGDFVIENLVPGYYEVEVGQQIHLRNQRTKQAVTASSKSPAEVELVLVVRKLPDK